MVDLSDRKKAMEEKYFQDAEQSFKLTSRRDRLLAKWIAGLLGRDDFAAYADEVAHARFSGGGDAGVVSKALSDLQAAGHKISEQELAEKMRELMVEAAEALTAEGGSR
jgi:hypothetical protein